MLLAIRCSLKIADRNARSEACVRWPILSVRFIRKLCLRRDGDDAHGEEKDKKMSSERAAPCKHAGTPLPSVVQKVSTVIASLGSDSAFLASKGLTPDEYLSAFPTAIEALRGSQSASNADRRRFLMELFRAMLAQGLISNLTMPTYGDDTVYRLTIENFGDVAIVQKGCPDGAHSSVRWSAPDWARETYLWWLCSSLKADPGEHIVKGVNRLRQRFFSDAPDTIDGVIFHNELCGTAQRPCPKIATAIQVGDRLVPPPCIYVMPERDPLASQWNWDGERDRVFPSILLSLFGIKPEIASAYIGHVGFQNRGGTMRSTTTSRFGPGRFTTFRN